MGELVIEATKRQRAGSRWRGGAGVARPIVFKGFEAGGMRVCRRDGEDIVFEPSKDAETGTLWVAGNPELGVDAFGESRRELEEDLAAQLRLVWEDYALAEDSALAPDALALKRRLLSLLRGE